VSDLILYTTDDGKSQIQLRADLGTVWLTQLEMAELFDATKQNISLHLKNIIEDGELNANSVVKESLTTAADGKSYRTQLYNLDAILAVGYRVRSPRGVQFRRWASTVLKEYLVKGFVMDDERLKNPDGRPDYFDEMLARIRDIRASEKRFYQKVHDLFALAADYDKTDEATKTFFATVQNLLLYAVTQQTAAELIVARANPADPHFGLLAWKGDKVRKQDIVVAKNYLTEDEIDTLNRLVVIFLETAELRAKRQTITSMNFWRENVGQIIVGNGFPLLSGAGSISHARMEQKHDRTEPKEAGQYPVGDCRPTARGDGRGRLPRLHAVLPVPALPVGQLRGGRKKELGSDYPAQIDGSVSTPLQLWYESNLADVPEFEKQMRRKVHYVIEPQHLWSNIANMARTQDAWTFCTRCRRASSTSKPSLSRARFRACSPRLTSPRPSWARTTPSAMPSCAPSSRRLPTGWRVLQGVDTLGDAYEYLIGQFAAGSGKKAGEFYTPQQISDILSAIVTLDSQEPKTGVRQRLDSVMDFACGSGSLLLNVRRRMGRGHALARFTGREEHHHLQPGAHEHAAARGEGHRVRNLPRRHAGQRLGHAARAEPGQKARVRRHRGQPALQLPLGAGRGDGRRRALQEPRPGAQVGGGLCLFAARLSLPERRGGDGHHPAARGAVPGRGGGAHPHQAAEGRAHRHGDRPAVQPVLFHGIPVCILVLKKCKKPDDVLFINAAEHFVKGKRQNQLTDEHIAKIIKTYQFREEEARYARRVGMAEIEKNDFNLNISRYISTAVGEAEIDLDDTHQALLEIEKAIAAAKDKHNGF
jgi:hypothetical protein